MESHTTPEQSLRLIEETILQAKRSYQKVNFYFILWGFLFALAGIGAHLLAQAGSNYNWVVWPAAGVIGGIISTIHGNRQAGGQHVRTMMDRLHQWLWLSYIITLIIVIVALVKNGQDPNPFVLVITALPTFVSGALMRFRPLMIGGVLLWSIGSIAFFTLREYSALVYSFGLIVGYVIPGLMLKRQEDGVRTA